MVLLAAALLLALPGALGATHTFHVDCEKGLDEATGDIGAPFLTPHRAQAAIREARAASDPGASDDAVVHISGVCELKDTLTLGPADSNTHYIGAAGAMLSAGTTIEVPSAAAASPAQKVDLTKFGFTSATLGELKGRGYSGGSACIDVDNFETSAAELFYRPASASSAAGAKAYGPDASTSGRMRLARFPNAADDVPAAADWAGIDTVDNLTLTVGAFAPKLATWQAEMTADNPIWTHGLWCVYLLSFSRLPVRFHRAIFFSSIDV